MSGVYAYCVLGPGRHPPAGMVGLCDSPVVGHEVDGLTAWVSETVAQPALDLDAVRRHHRVVEAAAPEDVVPLRFGAWQPDRAALEARVRRTREELEAALVRVGGCVEMGVRVQDAGEPVDAELGADFHVPATTPGTGRAYLHALAERDRRRSRRRARQDDVARRLRDALGDVVVDERVSRLDPPELVAVAHLVHRRAEPEYRRRLEAFRATAEADGCAVHATGPWPPYSFATQ